MKINARSKNAFRNWSLCYITFLEICIFVAVHMHYISDKVGYTCGACMALHFRLCGRKEFSNFLRIAVRSFEHLLTSFDAESTKEKRTASCLKKYKIF